MRHLKKGRKFGRKTDQRVALKKSLASSFFMLGRITTTEAKAKEMRPIVERYLTRAKNPTLANRRLLATVFSNTVIKKILGEAADVMARPGGYTRIIRLGQRKTDGAKMAILELITK